MDMAARTRKIFHDEDTRKRIKAAAIIDRLQNFALGDDPDAMSTTQVRAAIALLDKVLPALQSVAITLEKTTTFVIRAPEKCENHEEWIRRYAPRHIAEAQLGVIGPTRA
jgi:hypothetical protein